MGALKADPTPQASIFDDLQRLNRVRSFAGLRAELDTISARLQVTGYTYYILRTNLRTADWEPAYITRYPEKWVDEYVRDGHINVDPVLHRGARQAAPFQWRQLEIGNAEESAVMEAASGHGLHDGLTVPLKTQASASALSLALDFSEATMRDWLRCYQSTACMLSMYVHDVARRYLPEADLPSFRPLTSREAECVRWTAEGKTSWEIGCILGIAEKTANIHLHHAMTKLDAQTRPQLVARAFWYGLL